MANPVDHSREVRAAIVKKLLATSAVTDITSTRVRGMKSAAAETWPFIRIGGPIASPWQSSCGVGSETSITIHAFAKGPDENSCQLLAEAIVDALSDDTLPLPEATGNTIGLVSLDWRQTIYLDEPDEDGFHAAIRFDVITKESVSA